MDITEGNKVARTRYIYDNYGNVITQYQDGDTSISTDDSVINREFYPNATANILNKVAREWVTDNQSNTVNETKYYYDNNTSYTTPPTKGNITRLEQKKDASNSMSAYNTYDSYGNKLTEQDPNGNTTTWTYDTTYHTYPATKTYPTVAGGTFTEIYTYDPGTNNILTKTDVNGQVTTSGYDTFKRLITIDNPGGRNPDITYEYLNWGTINQQRILMKTYYDATNYIWQKEFFDGLGRVVQVHNSGEPISTHVIISSTTSYNNRGLVDKQYVSQDITSTPDTTYYQTPQGSWKYNTYVYDGLGRVVTQTNADGTYITHDYSIAWQDTVTNTRGFETSYSYDAFGRLVQVVEYDSLNQVYPVTTYEYDILGNLTDVWDDDGNNTLITYDWLSRKTTMSDLDMGYWSYTYYNNGNLYTQTDAKNQSITMTYDALNRITGESGTGLNVTYSYDSTTDGNYGKGRRTGMTDSSGSTTFKYDNRGRLIEEKRMVDSVNYTTYFAYDGADRNTTITYPTGEVVTNGYNGRGLPKTVSGTVVGSLVTSASYNGLGAVTEINFNNTLRTTFGYYGTGGTYDTTGGYYGRLWEIKTLPQSGGTALLDVKYTWDAGGNLATREDVLAPPTETFGYDSLDRLTSVSGPYSQSYNYNTIGNITSANGTSYTYGDSNHKHAVTVVGSTSYSYDANGNMTARGSQTITWDIENRVTAITGGASFVYDGDGNRIKKTEGGQTILYVNEYYEKNLNTGVVTTSYYLGDKLIAQRENTTLKYIHQDSLSSTSLITNNSGGSLGTTKYYPFGSTRSGSVPTDKLFTGQRLDTTGLYYYNARYYDPEIGRFISPDPLTHTEALPYGQVIMDLTVYCTTSQFAIEQTKRPVSINPQGHNRYSYCLNNPLKYTDPDGHQWQLVQVFSNPLFWVSVGATVGIIWNSIADLASSAWEGLKDAWAAVCDFFCGSDESPYQPLYTPAFMIGFYPSSLGSNYLFDEHEDSSKKSPNIEYPGNDPTQTPEGYEWRGQPGAEPGSPEGSYYNPNTGESLRPALDDPYHGPHWDYQQRGNPDEWRIYPDGRTELK